MLRRVPWKFRSPFPGHFGPTSYFLAASAGTYGTFYATQCQVDKKKVAIYGGAFDPITNSHMTAVAEIIHSGHADEVWIVPSGPRPDKPNLKTPAIERYCMCQLAINSSFSPSFPIKVSSQDVTKEEAAATYDMLCELRATNPDCEFSFVIGSDWLQPGTDISKWDSLNPAWKPGDTSTPKKIITGHKMLSEFEFLVIYRPGYEVPAGEGDPSGLKRFGARMKWMDMPHNFTFVEGNLSSTEIRKRIKKSYELYEATPAEKRLAPITKMRPIDGLVPLGVLGFIYRSGLYK